MKKSLVASSLLGLSLLSATAYTKTVETSTSEQERAPITVPASTLTAAEVEAVIDGVWSIDPTNAGKTDKTSTFVIRRTPSTFQFCPKHDRTSVFSIEEQGENKIFNVAGTLGASFMLHNGDLLLGWMIFNGQVNLQEAQNFVGFENLDVEGSYVMSLKKNEAGQFVLELDGDNKGECGEGVPCITLTKTAENAAL